MINFPEFIAEEIMKRTSAGTAQWHPVTSIMPLCRDIFTHVHQIRRVPCFCVISGRSCAV